MKPDLKPCPFCGGEAEILQIGNEVTPKRGFEVKCLTWGCCTKKRAMVIRQPLEKAREYAIEQWNRRPEASKEIERLREALTAIDNVPGSNFTTINAMRALALAALQPILPSGGGRGEGSSSPALPAGLRPTDEPHSAGKRD